MSKTSSIPKGPMGSHGGSMQATEKPKNFKGSLKRLLSYLMPKKVSLILVLFLTILSTLFMVVSPKILGSVTTLLFEGVRTRDIDLVKISRILIALSIVYLLSALFSYLQQYLMADIAQKTVFTLREEIDEKLGFLPLKYFDAHSTGDLLSRVTNDIDNISTTLQQSLTQIITSVVSIIGVIIMMFTISSWLSIITIVTLPLGVLVSRPIIKRSQEFFKVQQQTLGTLNGHVEEMYTGHNIIKAFNREDESITTFNEINDTLYVSSFKAQFVSGLIMPIMMLANNIGYVLITIVGALLAIAGRITIGDIQAFIQYSRQFSQPINQIANIANILQSTVASAERVFFILDETNEVPETDYPVVLENPKGNVSFHHVKFGYEEDEPLMTDVNIEVKSGQTVAIVGPTGAGKTTLINLLMCFYEIQGGEIKIDGVPIVDMKRSELRKLFGMVLQDTWLFNGTITENIAYGKENASPEEIVTAAKAAHADHFIRTLPQGYATILNEEGTNISQGQKQLLTIARALLANPTILILDEATSNVDTRTESYIQNAMTKLMEGRTNFVIAHRLSTVKDADIILVMKHGNIIEKGSHEELLKAGGFYNELYNSQFNK